MLYKCEDLRCEFLELTQSLVQELASEISVLLQQSGRKKLSRAQEPADLVYTAAMCIDDTYGSPHKHTHTQTSACITHTPTGKKKGINNEVGSDREKHLILTTGTYKH